MLNDARRAGKARLVEAVTLAVAALALVVLVVLALWSGR